MSNEEPTLPPVKQPNTPRVWIGKLRAFSASHPAVMIVLVAAAFVAGLLL